MFWIWSCNIQLTYILPCLLIKPVKIFSFFFCLENWHFYIQVYFGKCMFCYFIDIREFSYYENGVHILNISYGNRIYYVLWYHIKYWHTLKESQVTLDRSPEVLFKIYMYLLKLTMLLTNPWRGSFCPQRSFWSKFKYGTLWISGI